MRRPVIGVILGFFQCLTSSKDQRQQALHGCIDAFYVQFPLIKSLSCLLLPHRGAPGHHQITARTKGFCPVMQSSPVRDHSALKAPLLSEDIRQKLFAVTAEGAVDLIVGTHHRSRLRLFHHFLKRTQIDFTKCSLVYLRVGLKPSVFLRIAGKMLQACPDSGFILHAGHKGSSQLSRHIGILGIIFEISSAQGISLDIDTGPEDNPDPCLFCLFPDGAAFLV